MKNFLYILVGTLFGVALVKGEATSWFRIVEMFRFESFHMYGIFLTAIPTAALVIWLLRKGNVKTTENEPIVMPVKVFHKGNIFGGFLFGLGWAITGACPGPIYVLIGSGYWSYLLIFFFALLGTWVYGFLQKYLD